MKSEVTRHLAKGLSSAGAIDDLGDEGLLLIEGPGTSADSGHPGPLRRLLKARQDGERVQAAQPAPRSRARRRSPRGQDRGRAFVTQSHNLRWWQARKRNGTAVDCLWPWT